MKSLAIYFFIFFSASPIFGQTTAIQDSLFQHPFIDLDEWRDEPVRHRYVHGGFEGTNTRFSFYFPPATQYEGRFFQYITPVPDNENLSQGATGEEDKIGFSIDSGAYFIETNGGASAPNPTVTAYRANAAAAQYSRVVAAEMYGDHRPFGYSFGGSGGAYRTIGGMENTEGVWDGAVPYVVGSPMAIPNVFSVRMHAMRILWHKIPQIIDALEPGGGGDPYAGLNTEEAAALQEVTRMGFPPLSWFGYQTMGVHGFRAVYQGMVMADRGYFEDFWQIPGYLGADPPASLLASRLQHKTTITKSLTENEAVARGLMEPLPANERGTADLAWKSIGQTEGTRPVAFQLADTPPDVIFLGGDLIVLSGEAAGQSLQLTALKDNTVILGPADLNVLARIQPGDEVRVDNSNFLASQTYHRHQVPGSDYPVWDQFRDQDGQPLYPQRHMLLGPLFTQSVTGGGPTGKFNGKMIILGSLWDREAFPWQCDWYIDRIREHLGDETDDHVRLWYTDRALHGDRTEQEDPTRTVSYLGVLQQALRDLSAWVEEGIEPPASTNYTIEDGQVTIPASAADRKGIQPVVQVSIDGKDRADIKVGESVQFVAEITVPPGAGEIVSLEWNFGGNTFIRLDEAVPSNGPATRLRVHTGFTYNSAGTFFPTLRATSQRQGDATSSYARISNLGRMRVVVE